MYKLYINDTLKGIFATYHDTAKELQFWFNCKVTIKKNDTVLKEIYR